LRIAARISSIFVEPQFEAIVPPMRSLVQNHGAPTRRGLEVFGFSEEGIGAPGESRTPDLLVRSQTLYPAELRARRSANAVRIDYDTPPRSSTSRIAVTLVKNGMCTANPCRIA
jgi:hypothetical protein